MHCLSASSRTILAQFMEPKTNFFVQPCRWKLDTVRPDCIARFTFFVQQKLTLWAGLPYIRSLLLGANVFSDAWLGTLQASLATHLFIFLFWAQVTERIRLRRYFAKENHGSMIFLLCLHPKRPYTVGLPTAQAGLGNSPNSYLQNLANDGTPNSVLSPSTSHLQFVGFGCLLVAFSCCWIFMKMKLPGYLIS